MKNHIKVAFRTMLRSKGYSFLNITGLAIGIACAAIILLWVVDELTYNNFPKTDQLYLIHENQQYGDEIHTFAVAPGPLAEALKSEIAGIKDATRWGPALQVFNIGDKAMTESGGYADASILSMLDVQFIAGNAATTFDNTHSIVISETMAEKFFGTGDPVGQVLKMDNRTDYQVTGVYANIRKNSSFNVHWILPFEIYENKIRALGWDVDTWGNNWLQVYVELESTADFATVNNSMHDLISQKTGGAINDKLFIYPISKLKLYGQFEDGKETDGGYISTVRMFAGIAAIILLIACINFMNLATARSQRRAMEVGVRKTFGAKRWKLISQFISEAAWMTLLSLIAAALIIFAVLPSFNNLVGKQLSLHPVHFLGLLSIGVVCCVLAGCYPAFYLSSFPPIDVLRRLKSKSGAEAWFRKGLVVFQFAASLTLIICTVFIYLQVQHTKKRSLGMNIEQVLAIDVSEVIVKNYTSIKHELMATGVVEGTALSNQRITQVWSNGGGYNWPGKDDDSNPLISVILASSGLVPTFKLEVIEGRDFDDTNNESSYVIVNETLARLMGDQGHIGGRIRQGDGSYYEVKAVIKDFIFNDPYRIQSEPLLIGHYPDQAFGMFVRLKAGDIQASLDKVSKVMKQFNPGVPFEYHFMDNLFDEMFHNVQLTGKLSLLFAALAIFISCLGLFGLAAFSAEQRTKEIGIRKVLGASVSGVIMLLGQSFMILIFISFVIAIPLAWWAMHNWLQRFPYRIEESWIVFAASCLLVIIIAMLTVSFQSLKAAAANPVKSLKTE